MTREEEIKALSQDPTVTTNNNEPMTIIYPTIVCDDAISRKDIQDYIAKYLSQYLYEDVRQAVEIIDAYIGDMPSVTQKSESVTEFADRCRECGARYGKLLEQKSGKWNEYYTSQKGNDVFNCKECGHTFVVTQGKDNMNYCPNCGAKMESEV